MSIPPAQFANWGTPYRHGGHTPPAFGHLPSQGRLAYPSMICSARISGFWILPCTAKAWGSR